MAIFDSEFEAKIPDLRWQSSTADLRMLLDTQRPSTYGHSRILVISDSGHLEI